MDALPIFSHMDDTEQAAQLIQFLVSQGADIKEPNFEGMDETNQIIARDQAILDLVSNCQFLGGLESESEIEMVLNSMMSLVVVVSDDKAKRIVETFCDKLAKSPEFERPSLGGVLIRVLSNLFHGFWVGEESIQQRNHQFYIYCSLLKVASQANQVQVVPTNLDTIKSWFETWRLNIEQKRQCLRLLHHALSTSHRTREATKAMLELLGTYTASDAGSAREDAAEAIRTAIADKATFIFDHLLDLSPVKLLAKEPIHELLRIFVSGSLQDYLQFYGNSKAFVDSLPLNHDSNIFKMRVISLMSMGEVKQELTFDEMSKKLNIPVGEELEEFIIQAVQSRMIRAKMDQMAEKLLIAGVQHRTFERPQWEQLKTRLGIWTANLNQLAAYLDTLAVN